MSRLVARTVQIVVDLSTLAVAYVLAFMIRFDWSPPMWVFSRLLTTLPVLVALQYSALYLFGVPRFAWSLVGLRETARILMALSGAFVTVIVLRLLVGVVSPGDPVLQPAFIPLGVIAIDFTLGFLGVVGVRASRRLGVERARNMSLRRKGAPANVTRTLIVGAGQAGLMIAREIAGRPDLGIRAVGFVDDDRLKRHTIVHGLTVLGDTTEIGDVCARTHATQVLLAIPEASGTTIRRILDNCQEARVHAKVVPGLYEVVGGKVNLSRLRDVAIEDLLRRAPVSLDEAPIGAVLRSKVVLVTGAGGSIGSELCRQLLRFEPATLVLVERAENNLFHIHRELLALKLGTRLVPAIADVCDERRIDALLEDHRPDVVLHAAAHKHVPLMEANPCEAIKNNICGTRTLANAALVHGVHTFIMISTDKAVNPTSVMGATKRVAECYVQSLSGRGQTKFAAVRFGNVLGSAGSVVPIFREQIERGGPITVTDPEMRRYFMTIPEASQLVLQAASQANGGEIFVLDMGEPVRVLDLAKDLIRLSGFKSDDIEIVFSGVRPGEKLFEELSLDEERADRTRHPKIFIGRLKPLSFDALNRTIDELRELADRGRDSAALAALQRLVPEYRSSSPNSVPGVASATHLAEPEAAFAAEPLDELARSTG